MTSDDLAPGALSATRFMTGGNLIGPRMHVSDERELISVLMAGRDGCWFKLISSALYTKPMPSGSERVCVWKP